MREAPEKGQQRKRERVRETHRERGQQREREREIETERETKIGVRCIGWNNSLIIKHLHYIKMGAVIWFQSDAVNLKIITLFYFYFESYIQFIVMNLIISIKQDFFSSN